MFIEILFKILLFKRGVLIYAEHCIYIYIYIYILVCLFPQHVLIIIQNDIMRCMILIQSTICYIKQLDVNMCLSQNDVVFLLTRHFRGILLAVLSTEWFTLLFKSLFTLRLLAPDGYHCTWDQNETTRYDLVCILTNRDSYPPQTLTGSSRSFHKIAQNFHTGLYCCWFEFGLPAVEWCSFLICLSFHPRS